MKVQLNIKKRKAILLLLTTAVAVSCTHTPGKNTNNKVDEKVYIDTMHRKPPSSFSDTVYVQFPSAVFYAPDSLQLEKIKAVNNRTIIESMMHENFYQMRNSRIVLKQNYPHIKIIETNARYLLFKKAAGNSECIDLNTKNDAWGLIVSDGKKAPQLLDMTNIDTELEFYFSK